MPHELRDGQLHAMADDADMAAELIHSRHTVLPKRLLSPGPAPTQLQRILGAASAAPDHGLLTPWRFVIVPALGRQSLAEVFAQSLLSRDPMASAGQLGQAREKAYRAPLLMLAIVHHSKGGAAIDTAERLVSAGCAIQNMLLMATAMGFGSALTGGKALHFQGLTDLFGLEQGERALCFVSIGTVQGQPRARERPGIDCYVSELAPGPHTPKDLFFSIARSTL
jgi:nitroreductase